VKRYDLRHLQNSFADRMLEIIEHELVENEVAIFMFEIGDFSNVTLATNLLNGSCCVVLNSLKYNEVDWTITIKKESNKQEELSSE
jgi:NADH-quinone oxidoreductase subunit E